MKILNALQIKEVDKFCIQNEPISSFDLMQRAAKNLTKIILESCPRFEQYTVFCGPGNNGGDGLLIAANLCDAGKFVRVYITKAIYLDEFTLALKTIQSKGIEPIVLEEQVNLVDLLIHEGDCLIDALFGAGLSRPLEGFIAELVQKINSSRNFIVSIDLPSGLSPDTVFESNVYNTITASITLSIHLPKLAFMFSENGIFVGEFHCVEIGLNNDFIKEQKSPIYVDTDLISKLIQPRSPFGHKGTFGHALIIAGSEGKVGASLLSASAALRSGCGLLTAVIPSEAITAMHAYLPEAMVISTQEFSTVDLNKFDAIGIGPGLGVDSNAYEILKLVMKIESKALVIDADAINTISLNKGLLQKLNSKMLLTPHPGEFDRLTKKHKNEFDRFKTQQLFSEKYNVMVVLKGHHTSITSPNGDCYFNSTGNNGMATAGSGDVLTGIITSLCAQGYSVCDSAIIGVYLHGYAGDVAAAKNSKTSMIASDIVHNIGVFFKTFEK